MIRMHTAHAFSHSIAMSLLASILLFAPAALAAEPTDAPSGETVVQVFQGQSKLLHTDWPVKRVSVTSPKIADVQVLTPRQVLLLGKSVGSTDMIMWSEDERIQHARVDVTNDIRQLTEHLGRMFPHAKLTLYQAGQVLTITGSMRSAQEIQHLHSFLDSMEIQYVDMTTLAGVQQVQIQVRIAEVSRTAIKAMGMNTVIAGDSFIGGSTFGSASGGPINPINIRSSNGAGDSLFTSDIDISPSITMFAGFPSSDLITFIQALSENQYLRVLAEPTLVAVSGETASFLAGGEFPIPVVQGGGTDGTAISVEYREFGVRLTFKPTVLGDGRIRLYVAPEVSNLSDKGAVIIEGFRIPAITARRAQTTLTLNSGQTFAMAGLLSRLNTGTNSRAPILGDIPILGALFRSTRYQNEETELVVMVTASLVEPMNLRAGTPPVPGDLNIKPTDWELYAEGKLQGGLASRLSEKQGHWLRQMGLHRLRGRGAWAPYAAPFSSDANPTN